MDVAEKTDVERKDEDTYISELIPRLSEQYDETDNGTVVASSR